jgi:hypothetical protein
MRIILHGALVGLLATASLTGCTSKIEAEKNRLEILKRDGDKDAICRQAKVVASAYLDAQDEQGYKINKLSADIACQDADLSRIR